MDALPTAPGPGLVLTSPLRWDPKLSPRGTYRSGGGLTRFLTPRRLVIGAVVLLLLILLYSLGSGDDEPAETDDLQTLVENAESQAGYTNVIVTVDGRSVVLSGTVPTTADRLAATKVAESVPDVIGVNGDELVATDTGPAPETVTAEAPELELQGDLSGLSARSPIQFETSSADLIASSTATLDEIVTMLETSPSVQVEVGGHTDADGDPESNLTLSQERAQAVVDYLVGAGIAADRLAAEGYGDTDPVASNDTQDGKAQNRRIEFNIIPG